MSIRQIRFFAVPLILSLAILACSLTAENPQPEPAMPLPTGIVNVAPTDTLPTQLTQPAPPAPPAATSQPTQPAATSQPTLPAAEPVFQIDRTDLKSVAQGFLWMVERRDASVLKDSVLFIEDYFLLMNNPVEGGQRIAQQEFWSSLQGRLDTSPNVACLGFHQDTESIKIWTSGWQPAWEMTEFCYAGCRSLDPPQKSDQVAFVFREGKAGYSLSHMLIGKYDQAYWDPDKTQMVLTCDPSALVDPSTLVMLTPPCKGLLQTRLKVDGFASVSTEPPVPNRVRSGPGKKYQVVGQINPGKGMEIIDGPHCVDGLVWWEVVEFGSGLQGWTAEGDADGYWLVPCESREDCGG